MSLVTSPKWPILCRVGRKPYSLTVLYGKESSATEILVQLPAISKGEVSDFRIGLIILWDKAQSRKNYCDKSETSLPGHRPTGASVPVD